MATYKEVTENMRVLAELIRNSQPDADDIILAATLEQEAARRDSESIG